MTKFRRKSPRRPFNGLSAILHKGKLYPCPCSQIGEGGALIKATKDTPLFKEGDEIIMTIFFPRIGGIVSRAQCLYRSATGDIGVSFSEIKMDSKKIIREYVSKKKSNSSQNAQTI